MTIRSMTGYGWADGQCEAGSVRVEVRTVNYKVFKFTPRVPDFLRFKEGKLEKIVKNYVKRGHFYLNVDAQLSNETIDRLLDKEKLLSYVKSTKEVLPQGVEITAEIGGLVELPGVMDLEALPDEMREEIFDKVVEVLEKALDKLDAMRKNEGDSLESNLLKHCESLEKRINKLSEALPGAVREYQQKLHQKVNDLLDNTDISLDGEGICREVALMAEKSDVAEELERLENHLKKFREALENKQRGGGKKLEFLTQEMHREANTLGSKLPTADLIHNALDIKSEVHQLREQVMNVE